MSKKRYRQYLAPVTTPSSTSELTEEYRVIKHDLIRVLILNAIFLAAVLTVYYTNAQSGYLERWFAQVLKF